ncbi:hypothetical protein [Streptomyces sp. NPDC021020]|uniref:hypothetical protein n=1 Tax=Streptomyces sp. NPDC021020 TaxID=3365109 RepID=UPI0037A4D06F
MIPIAPFVTVVVLSVLARNRNKLRVPRDPARKFGLTPARRTDTERAAPDPAGDAALKAVRAGDWQPAADFLAHADGSGAPGTDTSWDERSRRTRLLGEEAARADGWLTAWRTARPDDAGAALVHGDALVHKAWQARGSGLAKNTTRDQFENFAVQLDRALPALKEAARRAPGDPAPLVAQIPVAYGQGWSHERFRELWAEITACDPHNLTGHLAALQFWCAKWRGSDDLARGFAEQAAASAPAGTLLEVLRLHEIYERRTGDEDENHRWRTTSGRAAIDAAIDAVEAAPAGHLLAPRVHLTLAYALAHADRHAEAVVHFRAADGYAGAAPWSYFRAPRTYFGHVRARSLRAWAAEGRPAPPPRRVREPHA